MSSKGKRKFFPNGYYTHKEWVKLVTDKEAFELYRRTFNTGNGKSKCPPVDLTEDGACYYCQDCFDNCSGAVKEYKKHYMVRNLKYLKEDMEE